MMTNLFSIFDPSTSTFNFQWSWLSILFPLILMSPKMWALPSINKSIIHSLNKMLFKEFSPILSLNSHFLSPYFSSVFIMIMMINFFGLAPYIFTPSSHMLYTLALSLPLWLAFMMYGWWKNSNNMFAHLVPSGTPGPLMNFMVLIETISLLIRPLTLAIRLMANMTAGHLILCLISSTIPLMAPLSSMMFMAQILLFILETAVAFIQAYVFTILTLLYLNETK